jgi:hypothetical protein
VTSDGQRDSAPATVRITVTPSNTAPVWESASSATFAMNAAQTGIFQVPGAAGSNVQVSFQFAQRAAGFNNELGLYLVDDASGRIGNLMPGDVGYASAALSSARAMRLFASGQSAGSSTTLTLRAGQFVGTYLIQNGSIDRWRSKNPDNAANMGHLALFSVVKANPDGFDHLRTSIDANGKLRMAWEDSTFGGDRDYDDAVIVGSLTAAAGGQGFRFQAKAGDKDGDTIGYSLLSAPAGARIDPASGLLTWDKPTVGTHQFRLLADDGKGGRTEQLFTLTVTAQTPLTTDDRFDVAEDCSVSGNVLANDRSQNGSALRAELVAGSGPANGSVTLDANGRFSYRPRADFAGTNTFSYRAIDSNGAMTVAKVVVTVAAVNDAPVAVCAQLTTQEDVALAIDLSAYLTDVDGDNVTPVIVTGPCHGTLVRKADGTYLYVPNKDFSGTDSFTIRGSDGKAFSNLAQVSIRVNPVNDAPQACNASAEVRRDGSVRIDFRQLIGDVDGNCLSLTVGKAGHGTLYRESEGVYIYRPLAGYAGADSFSYTVSDGALSTSARIDINVLQKPGNRYGNASASIVIGAKVGPAAPVANTNGFIVINLGAAAASRTPSSAPVIDWSSTIELANGPAHGGNAGWLADFLGGGQASAPGLSGWGVKLKGGA